LTRRGFGLFRFRSPLLTESRLISLPRGTKMFQFPRFPLSSRPITVGALPHSGISGSKRARRSPEHFAGRRALHRLLAPRHPPAALCSLILQTAAAPQLASMGSEAWVRLRSLPSPRLGTGREGVTVIVALRRTTASRQGSTLPLFYNLYLLFHSAVFNVRPLLFGEESHWPRVSVLC
jgi:hypothetical protein